VQKWCYPQTKIKTPNATNNVQQLKEQPAMIVGLEDLLALPVHEAMGKFLGQQQTLILSSPVMLRRKVCHITLEEQPTADCWIGGSHSAPCLWSNGKISRATADFDAVITSDVEKESLSSQAATPEAPSNIEQLTQQPSQS
jgi:hypothetical protein